jgi:hypothetical protein
MLRVLLLVSSAGSGWCHIAKLALAWLCMLLGLLTSSELSKLVSSAGCGCSDVAILALLCMLRVLLLVSSAGCCARKLH